MYAFESAPLKSYLEVPESSVNSKNRLPTCCAQCQRTIFTGYELYFEFNNFAYHKNCYKCLCCPKFFSIGPQPDSSNEVIPIQDKFGKLYCSQDFICSLKCNLCQKAFGASSLVIQLGGASTESSDNPSKDTPSSDLVHVECFKCNICSTQIGLMGEYTLTASNNNNIRLINCRSCAMSWLAMKSDKCKQMKSINQRLSSRQKEQLAMKILLLNIEPEKLVLAEHADTLARLSAEIKCSPKAVVIYIGKKMEKLSKPSTTPESRSDEKKSSKKSGIEKMVDDLQRMDKVLAPNVCPFGDRIKAKEVVKKTENSKIFADITNSI